MIIKTILCVIFGILITIIAFLLCTYIILALVGIGIWFIYTLWNALKEKYESVKIDIKDPAGIEKRDWEKFCKEYNGEDC